MTNFVAQFERMTKNCPYAIPRPACKIHVSAARIDKIARIGVCPCRLTKFLSFLPLEENKRDNI